MLNLIKTKIFLANNLSSNDIQTINDDSLSDCFASTIYLSSKSEPKLYGSEHELDSCRIWHLKILRCVKCLDNCYNQMSGFSIVIYTGLTLLLLYTILIKTFHKLYNRQTFYFLNFLKFFITKDQKLKN